MARLTIDDRRERALVATADALLWPVGLRRVFRRRDPAPPRRILCFRLERIGDLLMTGPALAELRALAAGASIDLVVGSWNRDLAGAIPGIDRVETLDADWLARPPSRPPSPLRGCGETGPTSAPERTGEAGLSPLVLAMQAARWRSRRYDLAVNFEPDIRTNIAMAAAGARRTAGFASGGGAALLDVALDYDPSAHTIDNARRLVHAAMGRAPESPVAWTIRIPDASRVEAARLLAPLGAALKVGLHVSGGRAIKQWPDARFREVAEHLVCDRSAAIVLTGTTADRAQVDLVRAALPSDRVVDLSGDLSLLTAAAVMERLDLFVTGDTGPMHLANAVDTPIVAVFGPSDPRRYAPRGLRDTVVRIDLPCSPCNRIRRPPERCVGHTPDCLSGIEVAQVLAAIDETLRAGAAPRPGSGQAR
jgi:ADP-heptose:LPS heptosyltransferase